MERIITHLLNYALDNGIGITATKLLGDETPSAVDTNTRHIVFNTNWHDQKQLAFTLAHEISHIMNGDASVKPLYFTPSKAKFEYAANIGAIKLLLPFYLDNKDKSCINLYDFMFTFDIPMYLEDVIQEELGNY